jgi:hypothetical protein
MLRLRQFAFPHNTLVLLACTLDAIFELPPIVRKLLGHNVGPARHIATDCAPDVHGLSNLEFVRRHRTSHVGRRADELRGQCHRLIQSVWRLYRPHSQGREAGRPARAASYESRVVAASGGSPFCAQTIASLVPGIAAGCFDGSLSVADPIARGSRRTRLLL